MRRTIALGVLGFVCAACAGDLALAPDGPAFDLVGVCPAEFTLIEGSGAADVNLDGYICSMAIDDATGEAHVVEIDNNIPVEQIGSCPLKFTPQIALFGNPYDRNRNRIYCEFFPQGGLEGLVVRVDDNVR